MIMKARSDKSNVVEVPRARFRNAANWRFLQEMDKLHPSLKDLMSDQERISAYRRMLRSDRDATKVLNFNRGGV